MKKSINTIKILTIIISILCVSSCSPRKYTLLDMIPSDAEFASVFSPNEVATKTGITVTKDNTLQFPPAFTDSIGASAVKDIETINNFLSGSGLDLDSMGIYFPTSPDKPVYVLKLRDKTKFVNRLSEKEYEFIRGQLGVRIYYRKSTNGPAVATRGNIAVIVPLDYSDIDAMWSCFYKPDGNPMSRQTGPGSFVIGDQAKADSLPDAVSSIIIGSQPECMDVLLFAKTMLGLR